MTQSPKNDGADLAALADRLLIRELIDAYSNCVTRKDWQGLAELWDRDCAWRTRTSNRRDIEGRDEVIAAVRTAVEGYRMIFQMPHAPRVVVDGDMASATVLIQELVKTDDANGRNMFGIYYDTLVRTPEGWKFRERVIHGSYIEAVPMTGVTAHLRNVG